MNREHKSIHFWILVAAFAMISGGPASLYLKIFNMAPPAPVEVLDGPVLLLMMLAMLSKLRETVFGVFAALPYMLMAVLALASYKWSIAPDVTLKDGIIFVILAPYLGMAAFTFSWKQIVDAIWYPLTAMVALSFILYFAMPSLARMSEIHVGAMAGLWLEKNLAGQIGVFSAITALARCVIKPKTFMTSGLSFLMFAAFVAFSTSRTSLVGLILATVLFIWVMAMRRNIPVFLVTLTATVLLIVPMTYAVYFETEFLLGLMGRSSTFTGRAEIWAAIQDNIAQKPLLGYGYNAFWSPNYSFGTRYYVYETLGYKASHSHNSFYETRLALGMVGTACLAAGIAIAMIFSLAKVRASRGAYFAIPFVFAAALVGTFEPILATPTNLGGGMIILILAKMVRTTPLSDAQSGIKEVYRWMTPRQMGRAPNLGYT